MHLLIKPIFENQFCGGMSTFFIYYYLCDHASITVHEKLNLHFYILIQKYFLIIERSKIAVYLFEIDS